MVRATRYAVLAIVGLTATASAQDPGKQGNSFDNTVAPLLARRCLSCHEGARPKGGLDLQTREGLMRGGKSGAVVVVPGQLRKSLLWDHVQSGRMPPKKPLAEAEKALFKSWILAGAPWGTSPIEPFRFTTESRAGNDWWSLQPIVRPPLASVKDKAWPANPIDTFVLAGLEASALTPSPPVERRALIRRVTFDLTGLPPSPGEIDTFIRDNEPDAYRRLVERLLAAPQYGERWARHWLDVVRFGESNGFEFDELRPNAWPYRDWVIRALNEDMPYDEFARLQVAGDVLKPQDPAGIVATGFLVAGGYDSVGQKQQSAAMRAVVRQDELEDIVGTVGQTFLGLTVHCARCHDHKFDPVRQSEYYRLTSALAGVQHGQRDITTPEARKDNEAKLAKTRDRLAVLVAELAELEQPARKRILAARLGRPPQVVGPVPSLRWEFTRGPKDEIGGLEIILHGDATLSAEGLRLPGNKSYASSAPLTKSMKARTLAVWVRLSNLTQRGGAALSLQSLDGAVFDAIVLGEQEAGQWLAGSNNFSRTRAFQGPEEKSLEPVHFAIVYQEDGLITGYRNGKPYGQGYVAPAVQTFAAGKAQLLFGLRHGSPGGNKHLAGTIIKAEVFDRALAPNEVAASAGAGHEFIADEEIEATLTGTELATRKALISEIERLRKMPLSTAVLVYACTPKVAEVAHVLSRGEPARKGPVVTPGGVAALAGVNADFGLPADAADADRRRALAGWITSPKNPLFARVLVNRVWHYHFGTGLVETPSDFGFNGGRPSHPELLDWLAAEFVNPTHAVGVNPPRPWSIKHLHRLIVSSRTYQQQARYRPGPAKLDAGNRRLWLKTPLRLEAEAMRDAILQVAGQLNPAHGGPGYQDFKIFVRGATYFYTPFDGEGPEFQRRSIYRASARSGRSSLLDNLDCPDPSTATPKRALTTTPLQALTLLNNAFILRMSEHFARRLERQAGSEIRGQVEMAYHLAYGRAPDEEEIASAERVVNEHGLKVLCRAIFNSNEFMYVD